MIQYSQLGRFGRLGNALFELSATLGLAERLGEQARFPADWIHRPYFSVPDEYFGSVGGDVDSNGVEAYTLITNMDERAKPYMQDLGLFVDIMPRIREYLAPSTAAQVILDAEGEQFAKLPRPILSVHCRRGDNVYDPGVPDKHNYYPVPTLDYYRAAIAARHDGCASVAVFSDDIAWCEQNLPGFDYYHHGLARPKEHEPDYLTAPVLDWIDLQLMARCDRHVLSNSSYGIWGALLADDQEAVICWPFYGPKISAWTDASLQWPATWTTLEFTPVPPFDL